MKTKKLAALAATLCLGLSLAACGGPAATTAPPPPPASGPAAIEGNELTVWCWDPAFNLYAMNEAAKVYQKTHPDFKLNVVETPWDDIQTKLTTIGQSKQYDQLPDIVLVQNNAFQKNAMSYPELFTDLTASGVDYTQYPAGIVAYSQVDGKNFGLPFDNGAAINAIRTDIIAEAGYTLADFTDITWSDFLTKAKAVLAKTGKPMLSGTVGSSDLIMILMQSAGASLFDDSGNPSIVGNDALLKSIDVYKQLVEAKVLVEVTNWDEYIATFVNGNVAGTINGAWIIGSITTAKDQSGKWDITNLPSIDGVAGATNYSANGGSSWAVTAGANVPLAQDFLKATFAGSTELYDTILPSSGAIANWIPAGKSPVYAQPQEFFGGDAIYAKIIDYAAKVPENNTGIYYYEARDAVSAAITKILQGTDPAAALKEAQDTVDFAMQG